MTEQEINVAIAEACGWKHVRYETPAVNHGNMEWIGIPPSCKKATSSAWMCKIIPNYTGDLNAIHETILRLDNTVNLMTGGEGLQTRRDKYMDALEKIVEPTCAEDEIEFYAMNATAIQCSQALLRAYEMWVD